MAATPLLLLPGSLCDATLFQAQLDYFSTQYEISVADISASNSIETIAAKILTMFPGTLALAGLSMGGIIAFELVRQAPKRVERLALLDTNYRAETTEGVVRRNREVEAVRQGGEQALLALIEDIYYPRYVAPLRLSDQALKTVVVNMARNAGVPSFFNQWQALAQRADYTELLSRISCPTLVLCGEDDTMCSSALHRTMVTEIPGAELEVIPNCGHLSTLEAPEAVNQALARWLRA